MAIMDSLIKISLLLLSISVSISTGLKCNKCGYMKNLEGIPLPGLPLTKDCKEGDLSSDYLTECPADSQACGKIIVTGPNKIEMYAKDCMPQVLVGSYPNQCRDVNLQEAIELIEQLFPIQIPPGESYPAGLNIKACNCDTHACNSVQEISTGISTLLISVGMILTQCF